MKNMVKKKKTEKLKIPDISKLIPKEKKEQPKFAAAKSFLDLENIEIEDTGKRTAPVLKGTGAEQPTLESAVKNAGTAPRGHEGEAPHEEKPFKYDAQFKYNEKPKKYAEQKAPEPFEIQEERTFRETRRNITPVMERPDTKWAPSRRERPVHMIQEDHNTGFSEEVVKYKHDENKLQDVPFQSKWHDHKKEERKYKMTSEY